MPAEERREQLLDATLRTAVDQGFAAVTMDRVARAAGVTRPVVYGLFPDRGALLAALLERETRRARAALAPALPPVPAPGDDVDPTELLVAGLGAYLRAASEAPDTWRLVLFPAEGAPPELQAAVTASREEALEQIRRLLAWGIAAGGSTAGYGAVARRGALCPHAGRPRRRRCPHGARRAGGLDRRALHHLHPADASGAGYSCALTASRTRSASSGRQITSSVVSASGC